MKFEEFKSGTYLQQYQYKSFLPEKINREWIWDDPRINVLLEKATRALGELNAFTLIVPDVDLFIRMHVIKEANTSSRIEGTRTRMDEILLDESEVIPDRRDDWGEVQNYIQAMNDAIQELKRLPISLRLLRNAHAVLMSGVRGEQKKTGRISQKPELDRGRVPV
jgi:Fic family protein